MTNPAIEQPTDSATLDKEIEALRVARRLIREKEAEAWDRFDNDAEERYRDIDWALDHLQSRLSLAAMRLKLGGN